MIKISYPTDSTRLQNFNAAYFKKLSETIGNHASIDAVLAKVTMVDGTSLNLEKLLLTTFDQLQDINRKISALNPADKSQLEKLKAYGKMQPAIASFFMEQDELKLSSCYYCNIDSIYAFSEFGDYRDPLDFIRRAKAGQFELIKGIKSFTSNRILQKRDMKQFDSLDDCPVSPAIRDRIRTCQYEHSHNHFTLDHFYHQADHHYIRLCLYNFIPCCYACNSKFKIAKKLYSNNALFSSPTSAKFSFHSDVSFKVYLAVAKHDVNDLNDFSVDLVARNNPDAHADFIKVLKLQGRYVRHKREALRLLKLQIEYPDTVIQELANFTGKSLDELKKQLFGVELYDGDCDNDSLVKYKRDIARDIELLDS